MNIGNEIPPGGIGLRQGGIVVFDITFHGVIVGNANVEKNGLYYQFQCRCKLDDDAIYRIKVSDGIHDRMLGVCIPDGMDFILKKKVPLKLFSGNSFIFTVYKSEKCLIPVKSGVVFPHIDKLEAARLQIVNGQAYILID